jgi:hypothetical protein
MIALTTSSNSDDLCNNSQSMGTVTASIFF